MNTQHFLTWVLVICLLLPTLPVQAQDAPAVPVAPQAYISVNSLGDEADADTGDGICDTTGKRSPATPYSGICTLRAAIQTANNTSAADFIDMRIMGVIQPAADDLPAIYHPVTISGNSTVTLDGSLLPTGTNQAGLKLFENGGGSTIQGLTIRKFSGWGVLVGDRVGGSTIQNNTIRENGMGIQISSDSPTNTVASNVIVLNSGLTGNGITANSNGNTIKGNKIGADGVQDQGNAGHGIRIAGSNNLVGAATGISAGGACTGDCNLIASNGSSGIEIGQGTDKSQGINNIVSGNFIGANLVGTAAIPNDDNGITTNGDYNSIISNLIAGNGSADAFDGAHGVYLEAGAINYIGVFPDGVSQAANHGHGILITRSADIWIGGTADGQGNVIAYNGYWRDSVYDSVVVVGHNAANNRILRNWNGLAWVDAATTGTPTSTYDRQPATNQLGMGICHLTPYALMGPARVDLYLPVITR